MCTGPEINRVLQHSTHSRTEITTDVVWSVQEPWVLCTSSTCLRSTTQASFEACTYGAYGRTGLPVSLLDRLLPPAFSSCCVSVPWNFFLSDASITLFFVCVFVLIRERKARAGITVYCVWGVCTGDGWYSSSKRLFALHHLFCLSYQRFLFDHHCFSVVFVLSFRKKHDKTKGGKRRSSYSRSLPPLLLFKTARAISTTDSFFSLVTFVTVRNLINLL